MYPKTLVKPSNVSFQNPLLDSPIATNISSHAVWNLVNDFPSVSIFAASPANCPKASVKAGANSVDSNLPSSTN